MNTKACSRESFTQFELSKITLKNLNKFKLSPTGKLVLLSIISYYPNIYPSQQTIADDLGISKKSVIRALNELRSQNLLISDAHEKYSSLDYKFTGLFFSTLEMSQGMGQNDTDNRDNLSHKQIKEQNNKQSFSKISSFADARQRKIEGQNYKSPEETRKEIENSLVRDDKTPLNDYETALKYIADLEEMKNNPVIKMQIEKVRAKWNI